MGLELLNWQLSTLNCSNYRCANSDLSRVSVILLKQLRSGVGPVTSGAALALGRPAVPWGLWPLVPQLVCRLGLLDCASLWCQNSRLCKLMPRLRQLGAAETGFSIVLMPPQTLSARFLCELMT